MVSSVRVVPPQLRTVLALNTPVTFTCTSGAVATFDFYPNSLYDPLAGSGSVKPNGLSELESLYSRYRVVNTQVFLELINESTT